MTLPKSVNILEDVTPASNTLGVARSMGQEMHDRILEIADLKDHLKKKENELLRLQTIDLPEFMQENHLLGFKLDNGEEIEIQNFIKCKCTFKYCHKRQERSCHKKAEMEVRQQQCFEWLRNNNAGSLVKTKVEVNFDKKDDAKAQEFSKELRDRGISYNESSGVIISQVKGLFNERLAEGKDIPMETFKVYIGRKAIFTPKSKKGLKNGK
jgi:hypothetical protein